MKTRKQEIDNNCQSNNKKGDDKVLLYDVV